jgi:hypothetical protein
MIRLLFLVLISASGWSGSSSVHKYALDKLSCTQGRSLVANEGKVVFTYGQDYFQLVVNGRSNCEGGDVTSRFEYDLHDTRGCMLGYTCGSSLSGGQ